MLSTGCHSWFSPYTDIFHGSNAWKDLRRRSYLKSSLPLRWINHRPNLTSWKLQTLTTTSVRKQSLYKWRGENFSVCGKIFERGTPFRRTHYAKIAGASKALISSSGFWKSWLLFLKKRPLLTVQQLVASSICNLSFTNETNKTLGDTECIPSLVKMLEAKPNTS